MLFCILYCKLARRASYISGNQKFSAEMDLSDRIHSVWLYHNEKGWKLANISAFEIWQFLNCFQNRLKSTSFFKGWRRFFPDLGFFSKKNPELPLLQSDLRQRGLILLGHLGYEKLSIFHEEFISEEISGLAEISEALRAHLQYITRKSSKKWHFMRHL